MKARREVGAVSEAEQYEKQIHELSTQVKPELKNQPSDEGTWWTNAYNP